MFTAQRMYNYSANSILSGAWCGVLVFFEECDVEGVFVAVLFSGAKDPFARSRSSLRILGSIIPQMWIINVHRNFIYKVVIYKVAISFTSSIANVNAILCFYECH